LRHKQPDTLVVRETYQKARLLGMDLDDLSDMNLVRIYAAELRGIGNGKKVRFSSSIRRRLRLMGILKNRKLDLTPKGRELLDELERFTPREEP